MCILDTFSSAKCFFFFLSVQQKQSLSSHFCTLLPSLISPKICRSSFCKSEQLVSSFYCPIFTPLQKPSTTLIFLLPFHCFTACRLITHKTASRGTSWPRGSWMLRGQARSCRQPKAAHPISTAERSAVARFMKRESRPLIPVGVTDSLLSFNSKLVNFEWRDGFNADLCGPFLSEPMWLCYLAFCLERLKRKTNVQELKDQVQEK